MLQPTLDNVVVKKIEAEKQTKGGIHLPDSAKKETFTGTVLAVGPGKYQTNGDFRLTLEAGNNEPGVKAGDVAVFNQFAGNKVKVEEEEYLILQADEVLAILQPKQDDPPDEENLSRSL